jgi:hypothetical protein
VFRRLWNFEGWSRRRLVEKVGIWVSNWLFRIGEVGLGFGLARLDISTQADTSQRGRDLQNRSFH